ncbi:MAG: helix-turn-helix domain-containing protein [Lachnospira sp.]
MISLRVNEILKKKGLTPYWLGKQTGISQNNILKICNSETSTIRFDTLEKICKVLDCTPNDIFYSNDPQIQRLLSYANKINELYNKTDIQSC